MPKKVVLIFGNGYKEQCQDLRKYCQQKLRPQSFFIMGDGVKSIDEIEYEPLIGVTDPEENIFLAMDHGTVRLEVVSGVDSRPTYKKRHKLGLVANEQSQQYTTEMQLGKIPKVLGHRIYLALYTCRGGVIEGIEGIDFLTASSGKSNTLIFLSALNMKAVIDVVASDGDRLSVPDIFANAVAVYPESFRFITEVEEKKEGSVVTAFECQRFRRAGIFEIEEIDAIASGEDEDQKSKASVKFKYRKEIIDALKSGAPKKTAFSINGYRNFFKKWKIGKLVPEEFFAEIEDLAILLEQDLIVKLSEENIQAYLKARAAKLGKVLDNPPYNPELPLQYQLFLMAFFPRRRNAEILSALKEHGLYPESQVYFPHKMTPLMKEASMGNLHIVLGLIAYGVPRSVDDFGCDALFYAANGGSPEVVELLIGQGYDIHSTDNNGENILFHLLRKGTIEALDILRGIICDEEFFSCINNDGLPVLDLAIESNLFQYLDLYMEGIDLDKVKPKFSLFDLVRKGPNSMIKRLIRTWGANVNEVDKDGDTPLMLACRIGNMEAVKIFLECHLNFDEMNQHMAAIKARPIKSEFAKIDFSLKNKDGDSVVDIAIKFGHFDIAEELSKVTRVNVSQFKKFAPGLDIKKERKSLAGSASAVDPELVDGIKFIEKLFLEKRKVVSRDLLYINKIAKKFPFIANIVDDKKRCLLSYCMLHLDCPLTEFAETAKLLVNEDNIYFRDHENRNPLKIACNKKFLPLVEIIASKMKQCKPALEEFDPYYYKSSKEVTACLKKIAASKVELKKEKKQEVISEKDFATASPAKAQASSLAPLPVRKK